jgi:hypothetical protein
MIVSFESKCVAAVVVVAAAAEKGHIMKRAPDSFRYSR